MFMMLGSSCIPLISFAVIIADIISTVEFDSTGNYLATGDKGGRVVLFERNEMVRKFSPPYPICILSGVQSSRGGIDYYTYALLSPLEKRMRI